MKYIFFIAALFTFSATGFAQANDQEKIEKFVTEMDFESSAVDGKSKAPNGFYLQGRNKQSLQSMVKLRSKFRDRLRNSKSAVKAVAK